MLYLEKYNHYSDPELIGEYKATQDRTLVGILYKRYAHLVLGLCFKYLKDEDEAKDAVMHIFEKLMADLLKHEVTYFKSWLYTFSKNHCLMVLRNRQSKLKKEMELKAHASSFMETEPDWHLKSHEAKEQELSALEQAIGELNEAQQNCIRLFYLQEKSYQEVSQITGYTMNEVKSFIQNGKRNLKLKLEKNSEREL